MPQTNIDSMIDWVAFYAERLPSRPRPAGDHKYNACCPFHDERNPSFWFNVTNGMWKCESGCGSGNATTFLSRAENIDTSDAWKKLLDLAGVKPAVDTPRAALPHTLAEYAEAKHLPLDFLDTLGLRDAAGSNYRPAHVTIPYYESDGTCCAVKQRFHPQNKQRFGWEKGGKVTAYGVWLNLNKDAKALVLVEGESDAQTLWLHNVPALGIPGATNFQADWAQKYIGDRAVYIHIEPDGGGAKFREKTLDGLFKAEYKGKVFTFSCHDADTDCKDPSDLHIKTGDGFRGKFDALIRAASPVDLVEECVKIRPAVEPQPQKPEKAIHKLQTYRAADLYGKQIEKPPIIVRGLIPTGLTVLAGAPKRGKSWLALKMAVDVAAGNTFLGMETTQGDVLYLDLESRQYRVQDRLQKIIVGQAPAALQIAHESDRLEGGLIEQLAMWCDDAQHPVLIIIDTLGRVKGGSKRGENAYEGDTRILGEVQKFAMQRKLAVVCVHHLRKSLAEGDDYFERISGSMGITGACDSVMVLQGKRGDSDSTLSVSSRDFEATELVLGFDGGRWALKSANSEEYKAEQEYNTSSLVRGVVKLATIRGYWEGSPKQLLDDLLSIGTLDDAVTPTQMSMRLQPFQAKLCERDSVLINWSRTKTGRKITIKKVAADEF